MSSDSKNNIVLDRAKEKIVLDWRIKTNNDLVARVDLLYKRTHEKCHTSKGESEVLMKF